MKRLIVFLLTLCCILAACNRPDYSETIAVPTVPEAQAPTQEPTLIPTETPTGVPDADIPTTLPVFTAAPMPATIDIHALDNCTVAVSLKKGDAYFGSGITGIRTMLVTIYTYDLYDMVDISRLRGGDSIIIRGEEVVIEALDRTENGAVVINGGLELGGYELRTDEDTVYYEIGYSDVKYWQELGEFGAEVAEDFIFTDASDLDREPVTYTFDELVAEDSGIDFLFDPQSTTITIEDGYIVSMERVYTP